MWVVPVKVFVPPRIRSLLPSLVSDDAWIALSMRSELLLAPEPLDCTAMMASPVPPLPNARVPPLIVLA